MKREQPRDRIATRLDPPYEEESKIQRREDPSHVDGLSFKPHVLRKSKNAVTSVRNAVLLGSFLTDDT